MPIDPDIKKQLDAVVGDEYAPPRRWGSTLAKWAVAAALGVAMAAVVVTILHTHLKQAQTAPAPKRPVTVEIVPAK